MLHPYRRPLIADRHSHRPCEFAPVCDNTRFMGAAYDFDQLAERLSFYVGARRHAHSLNVSAAAVELAGIWAPELAVEARLAGLLHDNAKKLPDDELIEAVHKYDIKASAVELALPSLLHGKVGAVLLPDRFGVRDEQVAQAVADHVAGRAGMGLLSRILFVADQASADRSFAGVEELRQVMRQDLERAVFLVARNKLLAVVQRGWLVEPQTVALFNEMVTGGKASAA